MSQENLQLFREAAEAFNSRGTDGLFEYYADDIVMHHDPSFVGAETSYGKKALRPIVDGWLELFEDFRIETERLVEAADNRAVAIFTLHGRGRDSGVKVEMRLAWVVASRDGKAIRIDEFADPERALEAVGLSE